MRLIEITDATQCNLSCRLGRVTVRSRLDDNKTYVHCIMICVMKRVAKGFMRARNYLSLAKYITDCTVMDRGDRMITIT
jgi:hypothetical protein